ncbi:MAG TPA: hypothetical protein VJR27_04530 [Candidatus Saccharimonadales bacterium]|nr:hypothetical protein [Candidatus Saccharimonadales bacterium]
MKHFARIKSRFLLAGFVLCSLVMVGVSLRPPQANAYVCTDNGLGCDIGYFSLSNVAAGTHHNLYRGNDYTWGGSPVLLGLRAENVADLTGLLGGRMGCTNFAQPGNTWIPNQADQNATSAAFTILTMMGYPGGTNKNQACNVYWQWVTRMQQYDAQGLIHYHEWHNLDGVNTRLTFNAGTDVSYYADNDPPTDQSIVIYAADGSGPLYAIKRDCGNPIGHRRTVPALTYGLHGSVTPTPSGTVEPGTSVNFKYTVTNNPAQRTSDPATCTIYTIVRSGYVTGTPPHNGTDPSRNVACPPIGPGGTYTIPATGSDTFVAGANQTYCRELVITPADQNGGTTSTESCVVVVSKPYVAAFGGDVSAGNGFGTSCTEDANATVVGWNQRSPSFAGAGTQYAAYVLNTLQDFATAQHGAAGAAPTPSGLGFSNSAITGANQSNGIYANAFGTSLPCNVDYAANKPASANPVGVVGAGGLALNTLPNGASSYTGAQLKIAPSTLAAGQNITLYVTGDVYISGNITYGGSWTVDQIPNLQLIVKGNIFVGGTVNQLDGSYISQPNGATGGTIYTCTDAAAPYVPLSLASPGNTIYNTCATKLVVNGSFTAKHVELLRSSGTLNQSSASETNTSNAAAEVFNFNPSLWIAQPLPGSSSASSSDTYDSVVSLPPVL